MANQLASEEFDRRARSKAALRKVDAKSDSCQLRHHYINVFSALLKYLSEIRLNQVEVVEMSFQNMFKLGEMVTREKEELL